MFGSSGNSNNFLSEKTFKDTIFFENCDYVLDILFVLNEFSR